MDVAQGFGRLADIANGFVLRQRAPLADNVGKGAPVDEVHYVISRAVFLEQVGNVHDSRMLEAVEHARFLYELAADSFYQGFALPGGNAHGARSLVAQAEIPDEQFLHRHSRAKKNMLSLVSAAETSAAEEAQNPVCVSVQCCAGFKCVAHGVGFSDLFVGFDT